ncbi:Ankyrin repeat domain-containing protein 39-like protein [Diplonema papillatum]|nr:Ankyrin repeat domain-containing protein 39-like protein [Diplonema papillatum]|eukprot:gene1403-2155_t
MHEHTAECRCFEQVVPLQQTVDELDWDRGIWCPAVSGNLAKVRSFAGTCADVKDSAGYTALLYAASNGHVDVVRHLLVERQASAGVSTPSGRTALHKAASNGHTDVVALLLKHGADPAQPDAEGTLPVHDAADRRHASTVALLEQCGPPASSARSPPPPPVAAAAHSAGSDDPPPGSTARPHAAPAPPPQQAAAALALHHPAGLFSLRKKGAL